MCGGFHIRSTMSFKGVLSVVFVCLILFGSATYWSCTDDSDCPRWLGTPRCCSDGVCRETCYSSTPSTPMAPTSVSSCSYDYQCDTGQICCGGNCLSVCPSVHYYVKNGVNGGAIAAAVVGTIFVAYCCFPAGCPFYYYIIIIFMAYLMIVPTYHKAMRAVQSARDKLDNWSPAVRCFHG